MALTLAAGAAAAHAQDATRIAVVNSDRILRESAPAKVAQSKLEQEFSKRDKELQDMGQRLRALSDRLDKMPPQSPDRAKTQRELSQLDSDFQRRQREFQADLNQRRNEELAAVLERANRAIKSIAEQNKYDLILQEAVYVNPRVDITDQVIKALAGSSN
ncbi:OmpH family outer membrane protein [Chitinasiproducens palmae]|nr:OmpH family outer membrane protein [Chitinasiproducens palmae]